MKNTEMEHLMIVLPSPSASLLVENSSGFPSSSKPLGYQQFDSHSFDLCFSNQVCIMVQYDSWTRNTDLGCLMKIQKAIRHLDRYSCLNVKLFYTAQIPEKQLTKKRGECLCLLIAFCVLVLWLQWYMLQNMSIMSFFRDLSRVKKHHI